MAEEAWFAAGCFWGPQVRFEELDGVLATEVGYAGGHTENPSYREVCSGNTNHAEAVRVEYDPEQISYQDLLDAFWGMHDPTTHNRQGPDVGSQYRSVIFVVNDAQREQAESSKAAHQSDFSQPIVTEILSAERFWRAEDYHQHYYQKKR